MKQPPKRLLDSGELANPARRLLELGRMQAPVSYDVGAGAARFQAALHAAAVAPGAGAAGKALVYGGKLGKLCLWLAPALVATALLLWPGPEPLRNPRVQPSAASATQVPAPAGEAVPPAGGVERRSSTASDLPSEGERVAQARATGLAAEGGSSARPRGARPRSARAGVAHVASSAGAGAVSGARGSTALPSVSSRAAAARGSLAPLDSSADRASGRAASGSRGASPVPRTTDSIGELEGLARARALTRQDPRAAVELLERLARAHPRGYFVEEREALYVIALSHAEQSARAAQLAAAFLRKYPASPLAHSVRAAVQR